MMLDLRTDDLKETKRAKATLDGDGLSGTAQFIEYLVGDFYYVKVVLDLKGDPAKLKPGKHAVHIHEKADCSGGFKCAGGHFDPGPSGNADPDVNHPFHAGDLPNITVDDKGVGHLEAITSRVTLSDGPRSILSAPAGTSLMVHGNPDPYTSGNSGSGISGGPRIACGIIEAV
ncbi:MAG: superoxide dismutase copper/zinc binding protein [Candidatus Saccharibacteria bacterium]|nr:superoxide dismutase copper/zinc binding protein [Candidatus Saccharibacteria bacterium]